MTSNRIAGCARDIGNALAKHLDQKGFDVFASCRDLMSPGADDLRKSCSSRLQVFQLGVANDESVRKAVEFVKDNLSTCGRLAIPMARPYSMSKFACVGFSESLRYELDMWGVQVIFIDLEFFETDMTTKMSLSESVDVMCAKIDEAVRKDYGEEFLKAFKHMVITIFPPSPNMQKLVETVECAISLKHPDAVYKVCRNVGVRALWTVWDVLPEELEVFFFRIVFTLFSLPKLGQAKNST
ncbi:hypothetical protein AVEN_77826-1 [Araneus ventricosus]|uniref:Uncharacterized protein n=1 Tax=Araneus ventricosus TaxID=182803 RepID=A0A4Y2GNY1_ARAVE|nr:hypothetical protein AVEN_77826-1 [Araneus ventricosus]